MRISRLANTILPRHPQRRRWLQAGTALAAGLSPVFARVARASVHEAPARLAFVNTHTSERLDIVYREGGRYLPDALAAIDRVLRDHRTDDVRPMDPRLLDLLSEIRTNLDASQPFHVISGYRSPASNAKLAAASDGVARHSLHLEGRAIDIRVPGRSLDAVRRCAISLGGGGVGFYPRSDFVHVDTGRVRTW